MKRGFIQFLIGLSIVACTAAIAVTTIRVVATKSSAEELALSDFSRLTRLAVSAWTMSNSPTSDTFRRQMAAFYENSPALAFVCLYSKASGPLYVLPKASPLTEKATSDWKGEPPIDYPEYSAKRLTMPLNAGQTTDVFLTAVYATISANDLFIIFRDSAIGMAGFLVILLISIIFFRVSTRAMEPSIGIPQESNDIVPDSIEGLDDVPTVVLRETVVPTSLLDDDFQIPDLDLADFPDETPRKTDCPDHESAIDEESLPDFGLEAPDFFSEKIDSNQKTMTEIPDGNENSALSTRLEAEISRAGSFGQDLAVGLLSFPDLDPETLHTIGKDIQEFFNLRELTFNYGKSGYALILPNTDIAHALTVVDEFMNGSSAAAESKTARAGVSAIAERHITSSRLLEEARQALGMAGTDRESRIAAFKPDPEKYRAFVEANR